MRKSYTELAQFQTYEERYRYLLLRGVVGAETFGRERQLNQTFYKSRQWRTARDEAIVRDDGCDLGIRGHEIYDSRFLLIHHINPLTPEQIIEGHPDLFDPENLITVHLKTHNGIHYGDERHLPRSFVERGPDDYLVR